MWAGRIASASSCWEASWPEPPSPTSADQQRLITPLKSLLKALAVLGTKFDLLEAFQQETSDHGGSPTQCVLVIDSASQRCLV